MEAWLANRATTEPHAAVLLVVLYTGLRRGEVLGLRWSDIGAGWVRTEQQVIRVDGQVVIRGLKTDASYRTISVDPTVTALLGALRKAQRVTRLDGLVFTRDGGPIHPELLTHSARGHAFPGAAVPAVGVHGLRHTAASMPISDGRLASEVAAQLGHADAIVTQRVYAHLEPQRAAATGRRLGELLRGAE